MIIQYKDLILQHFPTAKTIEYPKSNELKMFIDHVHIATFDLFWWNAVVEEKYINERWLYNEHGKIQ